MPGRAQDVADRLDALARAAVVDAIPPAVRLDAAGFSRDGRQQGRLPPQ